MTSKASDTTVTPTDASTNATAIAPVVTAIRRRTPIPRSTDAYDTSAPYVKQGKQSIALNFGVSGRLLFWFLHFSGKIAATPAQTIEFDWLMGEAVYFTILTSKSV